MCVYVCIHGLCMYDTCVLPVACPLESLYVCIYVCMYVCIYIYTHMTLVYYQMHALFQTKSIREPVCVCMYGVYLWKVRHEDAPFCPRQTNSPNLRMYVCVYVCMSANL